MRSPTILLVPLLLLAAVPSGVAHEDTCPPHADDAIRVSKYYVGFEGAVYEDTNIIVGLQREAGTCEDHHGRVHTWAADTRIA